MAKIVRGIRVGKTTATGDNNIGWLTNAGKIIKAYICVPTKCTLNPCC